MKRRVLAGQLMTNTNCALLVPLLGGLMMCGLNAAVGQQREPAEAKRSDTANHEVIPNDDAPEELKPLIAAGKVKIVYESEFEFVKAERGWADFQVDLRYSFKYNVMKSRKNGRTQVRIVLTKLEPKIELTHLIRLPASLKSPQVWQGRILWHEFDHVSVSLDPRAKMLLRHLLKRLRVIDRTLDEGEEPSDELLGKIVEDEITKRRQAVVDLMRQNNVLLDKVGGHGVQAVPDRSAFFTKLYTKEHLAEQKFPYVDQVLDLLERPEYRDAELPFLRRDVNDR